MSLNIAISIITKGKHSAYKSLFRTEMAVNAWYNFRLTLYNLVAAFLGENDEKSTLNDVILNMLAAMTDKSSLNIDCSKEDMNLSSLATLTPRLYCISLTYKLIINLI